MEFDTLSHIAEMLRRKSNMIRSDVETLKDHPTFTTKTMVRNEAQQFRGIVDVYRSLSFQVGQHSTAHDVSEFIATVEAAIDELSSIPTGRRSR